jgi:uncharacterized repeat protein (TIGR01451 family)
VYTQLIGALPGAGATGTLTFAVQITSPLPAGVTVVTNTVQISDDGANGVDGDPADNTGSDTTPVAAQPDLRISKTDGVTQTVPGQWLTYTIAVTNVGNQVATGVVVTDVIPQNTVFVSASSIGIFASGRVTFAIGILPVGEPFYIFVTVRVSPTVGSGVGAITNTVTVADDGANGVDPTPADNSAVDTDTLIAQPDLRIAKTTAITQTALGAPVIFRRPTRTPGPGRGRGHHHRYAPQFVSYPLTTRQAGHAAARARILPGFVSAEQPASSPSRLVDDDDVGECADQHGADPG